MNNFQGLLGNPMFTSGMSLLGASRDDRRDPFAAVMQGMQMSNQFNNQQTLLGQRAQESARKEQAYKQQQQQYQKQQEIATQKQQHLSSLLGNPKFDQDRVRAAQAGVINANSLFQTPQQRRIVEGADKLKYYEDTKERVLPGVSIPNISGDGNSPFKGTGMEAQALNIVLDQSIPDTDPRKRFAKQRLQQSRSVVTPNGTHIIPGYDLGTPSNSPSKQPDGVLGYTEKPLAQDEKLAGGFYERMSSAEENISGLGDYNPVTAKEEIGGLLNATATPQKQMYRQAADDWVRAKLRKESGAVISQEEMESEYRTYFPVYGDSPEVVEQKSRAREEAVRAMLSGAGRYKPRERQSINDIDELVKKYAQ